MFENIKRRLAHYLLSKKYLSKNGKHLQFNKIISNSRSFLIILPEEINELNSSLDLVKYLLIHKKSITIFMNEKNYNSFPAKDKFNFITYGINDITKLNLPSKNLVNKLRGKNYDIVIDLNRKENTFFSAVANIVGSNVRISFKKDFSESYYNLLFKNNSPEAELAFRNFLEVVRMF
ncbi:MAG: hypothetical protein N2249_06915 [Melioribacter sp.]|nr:hypothetical protein [Melioribacter sp.]